MSEENIDPAEQAEVELSADEKIEARLAEIASEVGDLSPDGLDTKYDDAKAAWTKAKDEAKSLADYAAVRELRAVALAYGEARADMAAALSEATADLPELDVAEAVNTDTPAEDAPVDAAVVEGDAPAADADAPIDTAGEVEIVDQAAAAEAVAAAVNSDLAVAPGRGVDAATQVKVKETAPIVAAFGNGEETKLGNEMSWDQIEEKFGALMTRSAHSRDTVCGINLWTPEQKSRQLGNDERVNLDILFEKNTPVTAAICGPAEFERTIPDCYTADMPLWDAMNRQPIRYGSLSFYKALGLADIAASAYCDDGTRPKPCYEIDDCIMPTRAVNVQALIGCICIPNDFSISMPFAVQNMIHLAEVAMARQVEQFMLSGLMAQSSIYAAPDWTANYGLSAALPVHVMKMLANVKRDPRQSSAALTLVMSPGLRAALAADECLRGVDEGSTLAKIAGIPGISGALETIDYDVCCGEPVPEKVEECAMYCDPQDTAPPACPAPVAMEGFFEGEFIGLVPMSEFVTGVTGEISSGLDNTSPELHRENKRQWFTEGYYLPPVHFGCTKSQFLKLGDINGAINGNFPAGANLADPGFLCPAGPAAAISAPKVGDPCALGRG